MKQFKIVILLFTLYTASVKSQHLEDYKLWLKYGRIESETVLQSYADLVSQVYFPAGNEVLENAKKELEIKIGNRIDNGNSTYIFVPPINSFFKS